MSNKSKQKNIPTGDHRYYLLKKEKKKYWINLGHI